MSHEAMTEDLGLAFEQLESNVRTYCRVFPAVFEKAKGTELFDVRGKRYLDFFAGAGGLNYGHNPDRLKKPLLDYIQADGITHALDVYTPAKRRFLVRFCEEILAPRGLSYRVQFCGPTGTNSVEAALKLVRKVTGRPNVVAFSGSFHGMTLGSSSITAVRSVRAAAGVPLANTTFVPYPVGPKGAFDSLSYLERLFEDPHSGVELPAAVFLETVQMEGGIYVAPDDFLKRLFELTRKHGVLLVVDDIQAGCGRVGTFFSFERAGIAPDLVTLSKSISGYGLPMALLLIRPELDRWRPGEHTGTFRGSSLSFVTAAAALDYWRDAAFLEELASKQRQFAQAMRDAFSSDPRLQIRGLGFAQGLDFSAAGGPERAKRVQVGCFERGLIAEQCGREDVVIKLLPPLTTPLPQLLEGVEILRSAVAAT